MTRDAALELLRDQHEFPGTYEFRVVVLAGSATSVVSAMAAAAGAAAVVEQVEERASRLGTYRALHVAVRLEDAENVLDVYEVLRALDGVVTSL